MVLVRSNPTSDLEVPKLRRRRMAGSSQTLEGTLSTRCALQTRSQVLHSCKSTQATQGMLGFQVWVSVFTQICVTKRNDIEVHISGWSQHCNIEFHGVLSLRGFVFRFTECSSPLSILAGSGSSQMARCERDPGVLCPVNSIMSRIVFIYNCICMCIIFHAWKTMFASFNFKQARPRRP